MNFLKLKGNICRICLDANANFNWNDEIIKSGGVSFKDCYYKYTQLGQIDLDFALQNLCGQCTNELQNAHLLFEKALKSYTILQSTAEFEQFDAADYKIGYQDIDQNCSFNENYFVDSLKDDVKPFRIVLDDTIEDTEKLPEEILDNGDITARKSISIGNPLLNQPFSLCDNKFSKLSLKMHNGENGNDDKNLEINLVNAVNDTSLAVKSLNKVSFKSQQNNNRTNKSKIREMVKRRLAVKQLLINTETKSPNLEKSFKKKLTNKTLTERDQVSSTSFTSKRSKFSQFQESSVTKNDETNEKSKNTITEVNVEKPKGKSASTIKSNEAQDLQKSFETNESFAIEQANELSENSLSDEKNSKYEKQNSLKRTRCKRYNLCQYCPFKTPDIRHLLEHEDTHLNNRERNIACSKCGIKFYTKHSLRCHMETHDGTRTKKHKCEFCEKAFFNKGALNVHRRIHLGLMYKCQICQKEYYRQLDLDRHLIKHSVVPQRNNIEKKQYVVECQYCKKSVLTNKLKEHMAVHLNQPQAKCKICNKDFYSRARCTSHLRRFHKIDNDDYVNFIHIYVKSEARTCFLKIRQERQVQLVTK